MTPTPNLSRNAPQRTAALALLGLVVVGLAGMCQCKKTPGARIVRPLLDQLWPGIYVTDNSLSQAVSALRRVLGCDGQRFIRTEARRGFRFICAVHVVQSGSTSFTPEALAQARAVTAPLTSYTVALESIDSSSPRPLNVMVPAASCLPR